MYRGDQRGLRKGSGMGCWWGYNQG